MKFIIGVVRIVIGYSIMLPFVVAYRAVSVVSGKKTAGRVVGKALTNVSAGFVGLGIPAIKSREQFPEFRKKVAANFEAYSLLYDVEVAEELDGAIEFRIMNCPFTSALKNMATPELCTFACAGDFMIAAKNRDKWKFTRKHSHGTDGKCCDHRYSAIVGEDRAND